MSSSQPRIDAHCHLFNIFYLTREVADILWAMLWGNYPHAKGIGAVASAQSSISDIRGWFGTLIGQISDISHAAFNNYEDNYQLLTSVLRSKFSTTDEPIVYPLMMDIHYMFAQPPAQGVGVTSRKALGAAVDDPAKVYKELCDKWKKAVMDRRNKLLSETIKGVAAVAESPMAGDIENTIQSIFDEAAADVNLVYGAIGAGTSGIELNKAYETQVWELMKLRSAHPDTVFPFLAVDPRRTGIMDIVQKGKNFLPTEAPLVGKNGPFFGIKLYPRLGYKPMDLESSGLYQWCEDNGIPITFHCSSGGFPPGDKWKYDNYGDPANWDPVLAEYNNLIVDFAHYGHDGQGWPAHIATLAAQYPNVYTDLACYTSAADLKAVQNQFASTPILRNRLMFGTDFNVMLVTDLVNLQSYFDTFISVFTPDELGTMACDVPMEFLGKLQTTQAPSITTPGVDREARSSFVAQVTKENRFGWVRDLPDVRDFTPATDRLTKRHVDAGVSHSVKRLTQNGLIAAQSSPRPSIDLRQWCPPVEDQSTINSCTAHAAIALVEYYELRTARKHIDASRLFLYKVSRNLLKWSGDSGARLRTAMEALALFGVPPEEYMPYDTAQFDAEPSAFCYAFGKNYQTASYYRLDPPGTKPQALLSGIRCALQAGYPLMFGFTVYDSMGEAKNNAGRIPFPSPQDRVVGGHAVAAVGYDDRMVVKNSDPNTAPTRGALLVRNSWGNSWGDHGYGWLPYEYVLQGLAVDWWSIIKQEWVDLESFQLITA